LDKKNGTTNLKKISLNFYSNFTSELLDVFIKVEFYKIGYLVKIKHFSYGEIEENIYDNSKPDPDIIFFHYRTEDYFPNIYSQLILENKKELLETADEKINNLQSLVQKLKKSSKSKIFISNFCISGKSIINTFQNNLKITELELVNYLNTKIRAFCVKYISLYIYDFNTFVNEYGLSNIIDNKLWHMSKMPFRLEYQCELVKSFIKTINASLIASKKCLVLDLDNTLWGGVLGEGDYETVQLGEQFPGNIFKEFQKTLLNYREMGILLAIVSKNNIDDVLSFINFNEDCLIKESHLSAIKANWKDKATNIKEIAKELNINLDAIVFFDNSSLEREWVKSQLPQVKVIDVPINPIYYKSVLLNSRFFDKISLTEEDKKRPLLYSLEKKRRIHQKTFNDYNDFIKNLNIVITIKNIAINEIKRVTQLINKVNQFNLTTNRLDENQVLRLIEGKEKIFGIRLKDKFGDLGIVGVIILKFKESYICEIDNFLISCRALGRKVEHETIRFLLSYLKKNNYKKIIGKFSPSKKNMQVKNFYFSVGFKKTSIKNEWCYNLLNYKNTTEKFGKVKFIE
tara:strand:- start:19884 stop:21596 length:1713 start_codon:yes stop_codon:yes gene_type:complete